MRKYVRNDVSNTLYVSRVHNQVQDDAVELVVDWAHVRLHAHAARLAHCARTRARIPVSLAR
jgi:hypothetical protein